MDKNYWDEYYIAVKQQNWDKARIALKNLINIEKNNPQIQIKIGDIYQRMGDIDNAIISYHTSANTLKTQGFIQRAIAVYKIILRLDPEDITAINSIKELVKELEDLKFKKIDNIKSPSATDKEKRIEVKEGDIYQSKELVKEDNEIAIKHIKTIFPSLTEDESKYIINNANIHQFSANETIIEEGDSGDSIFLIQSGKAKVVTHILGKEIELATLSCGDIFGEIAFLTGRPRTASVIAIDNIKAIEINRFLLEQIFTKYPELLGRLKDFYMQRVEATIKKVKEEIKKKD